MSPLREALRVKETELAQIELKLSLLMLRAPGDGVVSIINRRPGELVAAGDAAVLVVAHRPGIFTIYVPERHARTPGVGDPVTLSRRGVFARGAGGRVVEVSPEITELPTRLRSSPQVPVWGRRVVVDASDSEGMRAVPPGEEIRVRL